MRVLTGPSDVCRPGERFCRSYHVQRCNIVIRSLPAVGVEVYHSKIAIQIVLYGD
jgi:hypothetical protein